MPGFMNIENLLTGLFSQIVSLGVGVFFWEHIKGQFKKVDEMDRRILKLEIREDVKKEMKAP